MLLKRGAFLLVGVIFSVIFSGMCIWTLSFSTTLKPALAIIWGLLPGIALIGLIVGIVAYFLRASVWSVALGGSWGWIIGSIVSAYLFLPVGQSIDQIDPLFYGGQIVFGIGAGLIPVVISHYTRRKRTALKDKITPLSTNNYRGVK
jgi:hypothetical protein